MDVYNIRKEDQGPTLQTLVPTYLLEIRLTKEEADAITNNTERAAQWQEIQDAIAAWEAAN